jgi:hypothetical protein
LPEKPTTILHFKGRLTFEMIGILLNELKTKKRNYPINPVLYKKLLTLMIELLENILKYADHFEDFTEKNPEFQPEFELSFNKDHFTLVTRNPVRQKAMDIIAQKIEKLNKSNEDELKKFYRETITNGIFTEKGGAGLGLIEMAKITGQPLLCNFNPIGNGYSVFELTLNINSTDP